MFVNGVHTTWLWNCVCSGKNTTQKPPSLFSNLPSYVIPNSLPKSRTTKEISASVRSVQTVEFSRFLEKDWIENFPNIFTDIDYYDFAPAFTCYKWINSSSSLLIFFIQIFENVTFESYHGGICTHLSSWKKDRMKKFQHWSQIEETIRYLGNLKIGREKHIFRRYITTNTWQKKFMSRKCLPGYSNILPHFGLFITEFEMIAVYLARKY